MPAMSPGSLGGQPVEQRSDRGPGICAQHHRRLEAISYSRRPMGATTRPEAMSARTNIPSTSATSLPWPPHPERRNDARARRAWRTPHAFPGIASLPPTYGRHLSGGRSEWSNLLDARQTAQFCVETNRVTPRTLTPGPGDHFNCARIPADNSRGANTLLTTEIEEEPDIVRIPVLIVGSVLAD